MTRTEKRRCAPINGAFFSILSRHRKKRTKEDYPGRALLLRLSFYSGQKKGCGIMVVFYCFYCLPLSSASAHHAPTAWPFLFDAKRINLRRPIVLFVVVKKRDDKTYFNMRFSQPGRTRYISTGRPMRDA